MLLILMIEVVMIVRVYAMYNRSRIILGFLLMIYVTQVVILIVGSSIYSNPNYSTGTYQTKSAPPSFTKIYLYSIDCPTARQHSLQRYRQQTDVEKCMHDHPAHFRDCHVHLGDGPVYKGLAPSAGEMAVEQIQDSPHPRWSLIFPCVRPVPFLLCR